MINESKIHDAIAILDGSKTNTLAVIDDAKVLLQEALNCSNTFEKDAVPRFYKGQSVLVSDNPQNGFVPNCLVDILTNEEYPFLVYRNGHNENSTPGIYDVNVYKYCKPDTDAKSLINWIEWSGGQCPVNTEQKGLVLYRNGTIGSGINLYKYSWHHEPYNTDIVAYALIEPPEYFSEDIKSWSVSMFLKHKK